ncbi:MAG: 16S rRNA (guanine(966)-N(2))-methyltransferase RsmD [Burkholderia sp.]|nr:16S rRNA (guanine(966)-N(2))-methyltransferase RsmD [Burkholderia sp.]
MNIIRIIGGRWKRTPILVPYIDGLRPTPNRVRETLFNWLGQDLSGWRCLDLFAGTGALSFEAASRGAARVLMVEHNPYAAQQLYLIKIKLKANSIKIVKANAFCIISTLTSRSFDLIFLDPPFRDVITLKRSLEFVPKLIDRGGFIYVESNSRLELSKYDALSNWYIVRDGKAGSVFYHLLRRKEDK